MKGFGSEPAPEVQAEVTAAAAGTAELGQLELLVSGILRYGVALSFGIILIGLVWALIGSAAPSGAREALLPAPYGHAVILRTPAQVFSGLREHDPYAIIAAGLLLLLLTPVVRVAACALAFAWQKERLFTLIALYVLLVLMLSFLIGAVE